MLVVSCNILDPTAPDSYQTVAQVNGPFLVHIMVEDDGVAESPVTFDHLAIEILYNDGPFVIGSDPMARPFPGDLAKATSIDHFVHISVTGGTFADPNGPFSNASLLTLQRWNGEMVGPYRTSTGLAGIRDLVSPFQLTPAMGRMIAVSGRLYPAAGLTSGVSNIVPVARVFLGSQPVPSKSVVGQITMLPPPQGGMHLDSRGF